MENTWHLKSCTIWIQEGDKNTKFLPCYVNHRRKVNTIWEISDVEGNCYCSQEEITNLALTHFEQAYKRNEINCGEEQFYGVSEYPRMFEEEANLELYKDVTMEEILQVIKTLKGGKSPRPDG